MIARLSDLNVSTATPEDQETLKKKSGMPSYTSLSVFFFALFETIL